MGTWDLLLGELKPHELPLVVTHDVLLGELGLR
jgi:hypothetical protein